MLVTTTNSHGAALKGQTRTFAVSTSTKVEPQNGAALRVNDNAIVKLRGPKTIAATKSVAVALQALTAFQVVDQGASG